MTLVENTLWLTLGSKFEHNDFSGFEAQPTIRLMWAPHHAHRLWMSVSKAVRTPSRAEHDLTILASIAPPENITDTLFSLPPTALILKGSAQFDSEDVISYEFGYRTTYFDNVSLDFTAFYNTYKNFRSFGDPAIAFENDILKFRYPFTNEYSARTYGIETAIVWQMMEGWRWDFHYSLLKTDYQGDDRLFEYQLTQSPEQNFFLRSIISPHQDFDIDLILRYVDESIAINVDNSHINDYLTLDIRVAWRPIADLELSMAGQGLLDSQRQEYLQEALLINAEIERGFYGKINWRF